MKLDKLILVNWGQLPPGDYEYSNMTLLTGATGSGKSTMLDALQTVMTAAYQGIVSYNPGQDEVQGNQRKGKTKRTLESFICGAEYSLFSRPDGAHGYIAAVFRPDADEPTAKPFTALVAAAARVDGAGERRQAKLERLELVIIEDEVLSMDDFQKDTSSHEWFAVDEIIKRLKAKYRKVVNFDGHKKDYLCGLYGRFRGRSSLPWDETQNAAKAWCQSIAYKPIGSVHDLVRDDILEFDSRTLQESITRISDLMRQVTDLREEGARIAATVTRVAELKTAIGLTTSAFEEQIQYDLLQAQMLAHDDEQRILGHRKDIADNDDIIDRNAGYEKAEKAIIATLDQARIDVSARLKGISAHDTKERLEEKLSSAESTANAVLNALMASLLSASRLENIARMLIGKALPEQLPKVRAAVAAVADAFKATELTRLAQLHDSVLAASTGELDPSALLKLVSAFEGANNGIESIYTALVGVGDSVASAVSAEQATLGERIAAEQKAVYELAEKKRQLASGASNYPRETYVAIQRLREELSEAGAQVLCDLIEPKSESWQPAIEAYFGGARFNIIVKPEFEAKAINFLQKVGLQSKVIQGKKCLDRADVHRLPQNSIVNELHTDHPIAKAFLADQYGGVVKVESVEQLRITDRGVMKEGKGSGGRTMFPLNLKIDTVFGKSARERALREVTAQLEAAERALAGYQELNKTLESIRNGLVNLREPSFDAQPLQGAAADIDHARLALAQLDLTEVRELEALLADYVAKIAGHTANAEGARKSINLADARIEAADKAIKQIESRQSERQEAVSTQQRRLKDLCAVNEGLTLAVLQQQVNDILESGAMTLQEVGQRRDKLRTVPANRLGEVRELIAEHNAKAKPDERFVVSLPHLMGDQSFDPCYGPLVALSLAVSQLHANMEGIGLYNNRAELESAERSFHDVFTKQFCLGIKTKVDDGTRTLRHLNAELQNLKFGSDRFILDWTWEPEFADYYSFFGAVTELAESSETVDLFSQTELSAKHIEVRDRLRALLLDKDQERAGKELLRVADYRNYRRYEIWNESDSGGRIALSTWGTGSGGQLETPAYIVRAAVVTNRMKLFEKGPSLRLLVSDESFAKMDETRACAVLQYLRDSLNLQLISAMPTRSAGALRPEFEREYSFSRVGAEGNGELDFILDPDERQLKQDKLRELWAAQRTMAREQARLEFEVREPAAAAEAPSEA